MTTASEVTPSVTRTADPMVRPTLIRRTATSSFPGEADRASSAAYSQVVHRLGIQQAWHRFSGGAIMATTKTAQVLGPP